jgi:poly(3-hydroxybutyrate) depolymerase
MMKKKIYVTGLSLGTTHMCTLQTRIKACFNAMGTKVQKWLREQTKDFHAAGFDAPVK